MLQCLDVARAALGEPLKREGAELLYRCPHPNRHTNGDAHPSLKINAQKNTWGCFVCGVTGTAWSLAAFLAGVEPSDKPIVRAWLCEHGLSSGKGATKATNGRGPCVAHYVYREANANPVARKLRYEPGRDGRKKDFAWERWENGAWVGGLGGTETPLYRLPEIASESFVVLTEGEKDADAGAGLGLATTTSGGTGTFRPDHAETLSGKDVAIVAHSDDPGRQDSQRVAAMLYGKAASVKVCEIPASKDLAEAIEKGVPINVLLALFEETRTWKPAEGWEVLNSVLQFVRRFVALSENQGRVVSSWIAHTHAIDAAEFTPYLNINSAEKESGKTRLLEVDKVLVANPWKTENASAPALIRKIHSDSPTVLLDERDSFFAGDKERTETLRGILNSGYERGGSYARCVGEGTKMAVHDFNTFGAKALAGIGGISDTIASRSIPIRLKRARRGDVQKFRKREVEREASEIKARLAAWCTANLEKLRDARPDIPSELSDRQADCCEPLLAIADLAGGDWPETTRRALVELCCEAQADDQSTGVRLLADVYSVFGEKGVDRISSEDLAEALAGIETSPWGEWSRGKPISKSKLARLLGRFGITADSVRFSDGTRKGYMLAWFQEAFSLYVPLATRNNGTCLINIDENANSQSGTDWPCSATESAENPNKNGPCYSVPVSEPGKADDKVAERFDAQGPDTLRHFRTARVVSIVQIDAPSEETQPETAATTQPVSSWNHPKR